MGNLPKRAAACAVLLLGAVACRTPQAATPKPPSELERIARWEDARSLGGGQLVALSSSSPDPEVRARAQLALGRIQDPGTAPAIAAGMKDPEPRVRARAAFAAGLLGLSWMPLPDEPKALLAGKLAEAEAAEVDAAARKEELTALGRLATPEALARLVERLAATEPTVRAEAALALGTAARRGTRPPDAALPALAPLAKEPVEPVRYAAVYALAASKAPAARPLLLGCFKDDSADIRALCAKGLGELAQPEDVPGLAELLADPDHRVAVEATRTLAQMVKRCPPEACPALDALGGLNARITLLEEKSDLAHAQVLLALAQVGLPERGAPLLETLRAHLASARLKVSPWLAKDLGVLDCRFAAALDRIAGMFAHARECGARAVPEALRLKLAFGELSRSPAFAGSDEWEPVARYLDHPDAGVRAAAVDALSHAQKHAKEVAERLRPLLHSEDLVVAATAAGAAADLHDDAALPVIRALAARVPENPDLADTVGEALVTFKDPEPVRAWLTASHPHVRMTAARLLAKLNAAPAPASDAPAPAAASAPVAAPVVAMAAADAPAPEVAAAAPKDALLTLRTDKGDIILKLDSEETPLTSGNLYRLAKQGFFDGVTFHRIVPDFVVQGGDPHGDGNGGPGYTLRCEVGARRYVRGTLGMALSGKDTGGSQFFITTSPQPHLDGRYTAFGEVASGMEVVDRLLEGDVIREVQAWP